MIYKIGLFAILAAIALANDLPFNLTNSILFAAPFLLLAIVGTAMRQSVAVKLRLVPSPLRIRFWHAWSRTHDRMPTGLLCIFLALYTLVAITCIAALILGEFDWRATLFGGFMGLCAASFGRTLYTQGKDL